MAEAKVASRDVTREGMQALVERLGPADAVRFVAGLGGEKSRDSVKLIREMRREWTLEDILERVEAMRRARGGKARIGQAKKRGARA